MLSSPHRVLPCLFLLASACVLPEAKSQIAIVRNRDTTPGFRISNVDVNADIRDQVATVQIAQTFQNVTSRTLETQFVFPLPDDAAISALTLIVDGKELTGELKPKGEARRIYEEIVRRQKDPALLEFVDHGVFRSSVFPVPAGKSRRVEIKYRQLLKSDSGLIDFSLPLGSARHCALPVDQMKINVRVKTQKDLKNIYSPTHDFDIDRSSSTRAVCQLTLNNVSRPDDVRLLYGTRGSEFGMDLVTYKPDGEEQGYFMLLATPRMKAKKDTPIPKTVVFVVDRSGSMAGEKLEQAQSSLKYMIRSLGEKDTFNIVSYSSDVESFRPELEVVSDETRTAALEYIDDLYSGGGTNIDEALSTSLSMLKDKKRPTYVLFFTDGLPTVGNVKETTIAANAKQANAVQARVFSFGVGYDVNSRLLDRLSSDHRGTSVYVKPDQDVEVASTNLFRKVSSPAMTGLSIAFSGDKSSSRNRLVNRMYPAQLPDLFFGEQLVVVGRYRTPGDVNIVLSGDVGGKTRTMDVDGQLGDSSNTARNSFVEELWATRRIGQIIDELDLHGQNKELVDELVALSLQHGIMTPYTSFLADEETSLGDRRQLTMETERRSLNRLSISNGVDGFLQRDFKKRLQNAPRSQMLSQELKEVDEALAKTQPSFGFGGQAGAGTSGGYGGGLGGAGLGGAGLGGGGIRSRRGGRSSGLPAPGAPATGRPVANSAGQQPAVRFGVASGGESPSADAVPAQRIRRVAGKTFYWKKGEWQDAAYKPATDKSKEKIKEITQFSDDYFQLAAAEKGKWARFLVFKESVLIVLDGKTYRIVPEKVKS